MLGAPSGGACDARKGPGTLPHHRMPLGAPRVGRHLISLCPPILQTDTFIHTHSTHTHTFTHTCIYSSHTHRHSPAGTQSDTLLSPERAKLLPAGSKPGPAPVTLCHFVLQLCSLFVLVVGLSPPWFWGGGCRSRCLRGNSCNRRGVEGCGVWRSSGLRCHGGKGGLALPAECSVMLCGLIGERM